MNDLGKASCCAEGMTESNRTNQPILKDQSGRTIQPVRVKGVIGALGVRVRGKADEGQEQKDRRSSGNLPFPAFFAVLSGLHRKTYTRDHHHTVMRKRLQVSQTVRHGAGEPEGNEAHS